MGLMRRGQAPPGQRTYVGVGAVADVHGRVRPLWVDWTDGRRFLVDKVVSSRPYRPPGTGSGGTRFVIQTGDTQTQLFYEDPKWYVESKERQT